MKYLEVKSPTRVDLAGGTLDLWPIHPILGMCTTVNLGISIFTYAKIKERPDKKIVLNITDLSYQKEYASAADLYLDNDPKVLLLKCIIEFFKPGNGFEMTTKSESPVGGGLGGSSSLTISIINAMSHFLDVKIAPENVVNLAHNLEAQVLGLPTGTQDYYPPWLGGLCVIDYGMDATRVQKIKIPEGFFEERGFLVYTGRPHHSGLNNWEVLKSFIAKDEKTTRALSQIRAKSEKMRNAVLSQKWDGLFEIFEESYKLRCDLSPVFTSPEIDKLKVICSQTGRAAIKICGAGGGGCVFVYCDPNDKTKVRDACVKNGFQILDVKFLEQGSQVRYLDS